MKAIVAMGLLTFVLVQLCQSSPVPDEEMATTVASAARVEASTSLEVNSLPTVLIVEEEMRSEGSNIVTVSKADAPAPAPDAHTEQKTVVA